MISLYQKLLISVVVTCKYHRGPFFRHCLVVLAAAVGWRWYWWWWTFFCLLILQYWITCFHSYQRWL